MPESCPKLLESHTERKPVDHEGFPRPSVGSIHRPHRTVLSKPPPHSQTLTGCTNPGVEEIECCMTHRLMCLGNHRTETSSPSSPHELSTDNDESPESHQPHHHACSIQTPHKLASGWLCFQGLEETGGIVIQCQRHSMEPVSET